MAYEVGDYVTLHNAGDTPIIYAYANRRLTLAPGERRTVPWGHMDKLMGNPFLTNADRRRERAAECARLHIQWGTYGIDTQRSDAWPKLEAYDSDGERIWTILDDPTGEHAPTRTADDALDPAALRAQLDAMARKQQALEELLRVQTKSGSQPDTPVDTGPPVASPTSPPLLDDIIEDPDASPSDIPEDTPNKPPVKKQAAARK